MTTDEHHDEIAIRRQRLQAIELARAAADGRPELCHTVAEREIEAGRGADLVAAAISLFLAAARSIPDVELDGVFNYLQAQDVTAIQTLADLDTLTEAGEPTDDR